MGKIEWDIGTNYISAKHKLNKTKYTKESRLAIFDLDHTLIKPTHNRVFSKSFDDWTFYSKDVPKKLKQYVKDGFDLIIVTNKKSISTGRTKLEDFQKKMEIFVKSVDVPFLLVGGLYQDHLLKPMVGLYRKFIKRCNRKGSFYCGDAGGLGFRTVRGIKIRKDYSDCDLKFALNLRIPFMHRDEFIFGVKRKVMPVYGFDFMELDRTEYEKFEPHEKELIINVGYPGSGKSFYTDSNIVNNGYIYVNQDTLKTQPKCLKMVVKACSEGSSVVVDNTNPSVEVRKKYIDIAKKYGYRIRCLYFDTSQNISMHNAYYRTMVTKGGRKAIPTIAYRVYNKKFVKPTVEEGFDEVDTITFKLQMSRKQFRKYKKFMF